MMKTFIRNTGILIAVFSGSVFGQWNSDPGAPIVVCAATGIQKGVQSFADGSGGIYTFWLDARSGHNQWDVYGQHYDATGMAQWDENGKEIVNYEGRVNSFHVTHLGNGEYMMAWSIQHSPTLSDNGVYVQKFDADGEPVWVSDVKVRGDSNASNSLSRVILAASADVYYIASQSSVIGGAYNLKICKLDNDGNLLWPYGGTTPPSMTSFGGFGASSDQNGGLYVYHNTGNGAGAGLKCMLVAGTTDLVNQWSTWTTVTSGTQGLNYQYHGIGDASGITFVWQGGGPGGSGTNLYARRLMATNGSLGWNETTKFICVADGNQSYFYWRKSGSNYFITWADGRPGVVGNYAIYAQKFTTNGVILWEENGVQVANLNSYIPYPEFDLDENNTMCIAHKASTGFMTQKVTTDGTLVWGPTGVMALTNAYAPFYEDYNMVYTGEEFLVVGARSATGGGADNIYISKVTLPAVQVTETVSACNEYTAYGQTFTQSNTYIIDLQDTVVTLVLTVVQNIAETEQDGNTLVSVYDGNFRWMDCNTGEFIEGAVGPTFTVTESGSYALEITNGDCISLSECVEVIVVSTNDKENSYIRLFPNPGKDYLNLEFQGSKKPLALHVMDVSGRIVYAESLRNSETYHAVDLSMESKGTYFIRIEFDNGFFTTAKWIKL